MWMENGPDSEVTNFSKIIKYKGMCNVHITWASNILPLGPFNSTKYVTSILQSYTPNKTLHTLQNSKIDIIFKTNLNIITLSTKS